MPSYVVKVTPDQDRYVYWSTVTDSPHFWGGRAEMMDMLVHDSREKPEYALPEAEKRLGRADATGTSAHHGDMRWDDDVLIVEQRGILRRGHLGAFLDTFNQADESFDWSMLEPFEDDEEPPRSADRSVEP
jgi:hypothetical protein